jgi:hypothetical protein
MSNLMQVESREIGGKVFQIRLLPFVDGRKTYARLQKMLAVHGDEVLNQTGLGLFMFAGLAGLVNDDDLAFFCEAYGKVTDVSLGGNVTLTLGTDANRTTVFAGAFEDMFTWLDECTAINFSAVMGKLSAARKQLEAIAAAKKVSAPV